MKIEIRKDMPVPASARLVVVMTSARVSQKLRSRLRLRQGTEMTSVSEALFSREEWLMGCRKGGKEALTSACGLIAAEAASSPLSSPVLAVTNSLFALHALAKEPGAVVFRARASKSGVWLEPMNLGEWGPKRSTFAVTDAMRPKRVRISPDLPFGPQARNVRTMLGASPRDVFERMEPGICAHLENFKRWETATGPYQGKKGQSMPMLFAYMRALGVKEVIIFKNLLVT